MKLSVLLTLAISALLGGTLHAIPQTVGGFINAQNNPGNLTLEEWFRDPKHWQPGSELPGAWIMGTVPTGMLLANPGAVFGVTASQVVATRDQQGGIVSVQVFFDAETAKVAKGDLARRIRKAVALFTGVDGKAAGYTVTLAEPQAGAVTATLKR